jgi:hypothetical protein
MEPQASSEGGQRASYAAYVQVDRSDGGTLYAGEAIYRPRKPHPSSGEPLPMIGIPDDGMPDRPLASAAYDIWYNGERIAASAVYLERVSTCWWFILAAPPRHLPTA